MCLHLLLCRPLTRVAALTALATLAAGCDRGPGKGGWIQVTYQPADLAASKRPRAFSAPASAAWCPVSGRLEVTAVREDMGFGLALYPLDSLAAGTYTAFDPGIDTASRPGVAGVARWFTERRVFGFQSDSGSLTLTRNGDRYEARFGLRLRSLDGGDTTRATGRATDLWPGACAADSVPGTAPKQ